VRLPSGLDVPSTIHGLQGEGLADAGTRRPQHAQQETVALARRGSDDGQDILWRQPFRRRQCLLGAALTERRFGCESDTSREL
jgi:hypothetical protein